MTSDEKLLLIKLVNEHKDVIESKTTDKVSLNDKEEVWKIITGPFNQDFSSRSSVNLQSVWKNIKLLAKEYSQKLRKQSMGTGGGGMIISNNSIFDAALNIMNNVTVQGQSNEFDNDAEEMTVDEIFTLDGEDDSDDEVFEYLLKNNNVKDWKKGNPSNLKS
ncbi:uncharacterized protein LOC128667252 isoform X2 [Microplitis demolitor]|uniref:uncharacterized protein LOC128667252 isoform X2 n=1 Tax=Microplitis demolitor TaxID=69319 RepID=UPI0004CDAEDE|nr:uncharacterized protein LOC128667252 isoform X2 [Microplitis demolitor]